MNHLTLALTRLHHEASNASSALISCAAQPRCWATSALPLSLCMHQPEILACDREHQPMLVAVVMHELSKALKHHLNCFVPQGICGCQSATSPTLCAPVQSFAPHSSRLTPWALRALPPALSRCSSPLCCPWRAPVPSRWTPRHPALLQGCETGHAEAVPHTCLRTLKQHRSGAQRESWPPKSGAPPKRQGLTVM